MAREIKIYEAQQAIPEFGIIKGTKFYIDGANRAHRLYDGKEYPSYFVINEGTYFTAIKHICPVDIRDNVLYYPNHVNKAGNFKHKHTGIVKNINESSIEIIRDGTNGKVIDVIPHTNIIQVRETYYFINSSGKICKATKEANKCTDHYRQNTDNYFSTYDEAHEKLDSIINSFTK